MSTRGQKARQRDESRRIIDCVLCIITLIYSFYVLCSCLAPVLVCAPIIIIIIYSAYISQVFNSRIWRIWNCSHPLLSSGKNRSLYAAENGNKASLITNYILKTLNLKRFNAYSLMKTLNIIPAKKCSYTVTDIWFQIS